MIKVNSIEVQQSSFPDKTLLLKISDTILENCDDTGYINIHWLYENDAELFTLICVKRYLDENFCHKAIHLIMPYIPHARMDRVKNSEDVFTLKYFCEIINSLHFTTVEVRDAHSNVSLALLNNVYEEPIEDYVRDAISQSGAEALFFPDEGAMKRYAGLFKDMPYAFGMKKRDWKTGQIQGLDIINAEAVKDKNILIVDDICSRGGTFYHSAKALKAAGAKSVSLYVTHCEETITLGELAASGGLVDHVYTTKSILPERLFWNSADPYWKEWITVLED
jgi:ribose-phosphate pyrophosphokinase